MSKVYKYLCASLAALSLTSLHAEDLASQVLELSESAHAEASQMHEAVAPQAAPKVFSPFTGKVRASKVRLRLNADLESPVVREMKKGDLFVVVGEKGDFFAVEAPKGMKAYVFRSFVLDNEVAANRVNVRMEPDLESPVIAHLNSGDKVAGTISSQNNKWLEISAPENTVFYLAKEYVENVGGPELKAVTDKKRMQGEQLLEANSLIVKNQFSKPFEQIDIERIKHSYNTLISDYAEFPAIVEKAKDSLASLNERYIERKIEFLEAKANPNVSADEQTFSIVEEAAMSKDSLDLELTALNNDKMKLWEPVEEAIYLNWTAINEDRNMREFYEEQRISAVTLSGILEAYNTPIKSRPGDFILKDKNGLPIAYLYSTQVNLDKFVGKKITILGVERPNNNFAFPAYFVLGKE